MTKLIPRPLISILLLAYLLFLAGPSPGIQVDHAADPVKKTWKLPLSVQRQILGVVIPAIAAEQFDIAYEELGPLIIGMSEEQLREVERFGQHHGVKSIQEVFVQFHLDAIERGQIAVEPNLALPIALYLSTEIHRRATEELEQFKKHRAFAAFLEFPDNWRDRELLFWDIHVFRNRLLNLERMVGYAAQTTRLHLIRANRKPEKNTELIARLQAVADSPQHVAECFQNLILNEAEFHLLQLPLAVDVLAQETDFENRLYAAYALQDSVASLKNFFNETTPEQRNRIALSDPAVGETITKWLADGSRVGQDVLEKSVLLRTGTHWWLRGRYGSSTEANGLLKPKSAMSNVDFMFGLYMPKTPNRPISRYLSTDERVEGYDRRHFYTWAVEYRGKKSVGTGGYSQKIGEVNRVSKGSFW